MTEAQKAKRAFRKAKETEREETIKWEELEKKSEEAWEVRSKAEKAASEQGRKRKEAIEARQKAGILWMSLLEEEEKEWDEAQKITEVIQ